MARIPAFIILLGLLSCEPHGEPLWASACENAWNYCPDAYADRSEFRQACATAIGTRPPKVREALARCLLAARSHEDYEACLPDDEGLRLPSP